MARLVPALIADRGGEPRDIDEDHRAAARPFGEPRVERLDHREQRARLDAIEAAEQGLDRRGERLDEDLALDRRADTVGDRLDPREGRVDLALRGLGGRRRAAEREPVIGDDEARVQRGGAQRAGRIGRLLDRAAIFAGDDIGDEAVAQQRPRDRRAEQRQRAVADHAERDARQRLRIARDRRGGAGEPAELGLVEPVGGERDQSLDHRRAAGRQLSAQRAKLIAEIGWRGTQPIEFGQHQS